MTIVPEDKTGEASRGKWAATVVLTTAVLFFFPLTIRFPLLDPDEGLHAAIAQEMVEQDDRLTPRLFGRPFWDKPILYFWAQAAALRLWGFNEAAVRLPGLLFGFFGVVTTGVLAWRMFDGRTGWIAALLYATTILPTALAQAATHDVMLPVWINLTLLCLWEAWRPTARSRTIVGCLFFAGLGLGLSILSKGLTGVVAVALACGGYLLGAKGEGGKVVRHGLLIGILAILTAAPWYLLMEAQNPGFFHYYFIERHLFGFLTSEQPHGNQPWWYYLPLFLGGGLPWISYLPVLFVDALSQKGKSRHSRSLIVLFRPTARMGLLSGWLLGWLVFVTLARSKLVTYLWPAFPPLAILSAVCWSRLLENNLAESARRMFRNTFWFSSICAPAVLPMAAVVLQAMFPVRYSAGVWSMVALAAAFSPLPAWEWRANRPAAALRTSAWSLTLQFSVVIVFLLPPTAECFSARSLAEHFNRQGVLPQRLIVAGERVGSLIFYLTPELRSGLLPERLQTIPLDQPWELRSGDVLAVREGKHEAVEARLRHSGYFQETVGRYRLYHIRESPAATLF